MTTIKSYLGKCFRTDIYSQPSHKTAFGWLWCAGFPNNTSKYIPPQLEQMLNNEVWKAQGEEDHARKEFGKHTHILHSLLFSQSHFGKRKLTFLTYEAHNVDTKRNPALLICGSEGKNVDTDIRSRGAEQKFAASLNSWVGHYLQNNSLFQSCSPSSHGTLR